MRPLNCFLRMLIFYTEHLSIAPVTPLDGMSMLRVLFKDPFLQIVMSSLYKTQSFNCSSNKHIFLLISVTKPFCLQFNFSPKMNLCLLMASFIHHLSFLRMELTECKHYCQTEVFSLITLSVEHSLCFISGARAGITLCFNKLFSSQAVGDIVTVSGHLSVCDMRMLGIL